MLRIWKMASRVLTWPSRSRSALGSVLPSRVRRRAPSATRHSRTQLIGGHDPLPLLFQDGRLAIQGVDVLHFLIEPFIRPWVQPIAHLVRFEITVFKSLAA